MLSIVSNMLAINESLLRIGDMNGTAANSPSPGFFCSRITNLVDKFASSEAGQRGEHHFEDGEPGGEGHFVGPGDE
ncbi:hypothetical protein CEXT_95791 [Caerostris extrusa]|uniref:Uncharacterized protein n=1 Tax=Caerostris extrusa TaxID=172846 RepID=A0AAV4R8Z9_CAEEX|nr:hypothetical protein CEXT_95791 [Caerostris extrusa]